MRGEVTLHEWKRRTSLTTPGSYPLASPDEGIFRWLTAHLHVLNPGQQLRLDTGSHECVIDLLEGTIDIWRGNQFWQQVSRDSFFREGPTLLCIPPYSSGHLRAETSAVVLEVRAPVADSGQWAVVRPGDAPPREVGQGNWQRTIWPGTSQLPVTQRLLVGETFNPPGGWSSYPPHKHDTVQPPHELPYEEIYFFRFTPPGGFGLQRIYGLQPDGTPFDVALTVEDGDAVLIPRGYHPVVAAPGYAMGYLWALCGEGKQYGAWTVDPAHQWITRPTEEAVQRDP